MVTERRLIDANKLAEQFDEHNFKGFVMKRLIEMQPTVDAVEVVRCKDCKHCRISHPAGKPTPFYFCPDIMRHSVSPDDYCSHGERRSNDVQ